MIQKLPLKEIFRHMEGLTFYILYYVELPYGAVAEQIQLDERMTPAGA